MKTLAIGASLLLSLAIAPASLAFQGTDSPSPGWPQWRGPNANGFVENASPPTEWSETKNVRWKVEIPGEGSSTPIVLGDQIFLAAAVVTDRKPDSPPKLNKLSMTQPPATIVEFQVICLDRKTGKTIWNKTVTEAAPIEGHHKSTTYAAASPVTDGKHLFVSFGSYGIFCLTLDGETLWKADLGTLRTRRGWGEAVSPALYGDRLVVMGDQEDQSHIFTLNTANGDIAWQQNRNEPTTWATPLLIDRKGQPQVITAGTNRIRAYGLEDGKLLWESVGLTLNAIPSPVLFGDHVICMSGYRGYSAVSIDLNSFDGKRARPVVEWKITHDTPYVPSPVLTHHRLYFTKGLSAVMTCVDARTGRPIIKARRLAGLKNLYASPVATDQHVYFVSREGATLVIENSDEFKIVATNQLDAAIDASPAIVDSQLFLRSKTHLYCIENQNSTQKGG